MSFNSDRHPSSLSRYFDAPTMHFSSRGDDRVDDMRDKRGRPADEQGLSQHPESAPIDGNLGNNDKGERLSRSYIAHPPPLSSMGSQNRGGRRDFIGSQSRDPDSTGGFAERRSSLHSLPISSGGRDDGPIIGGASTFGGGGNALGRKGSVRTTRSTRTTGTTSGATTAFTNGAALTGPNAKPDVNESVWFRASLAERALSQRQKEKITKQERKESKKFSKLLKTESSTEKAALEAALKTLAALQDLHKAAVKREARAGAAHAKALCAAQKAESRFHEAKARTAQEVARAEARCIEERARWEGKGGEVRAQEERLESEKEIVMNMEERVAECAREVERLRIVKGTDDREREARLIELTGQK
ncbi:hypothetical protein BDN67DRAFT_114733 [Paxillus ammoniavirescens]|nr:hypothetical protein BDN67DRAFT_114733 [Paxillus ammoniavirescens]